MNLSVFYLTGSRPEDYIVIAFVFSFHLEPSDREGTESKSCVDVYIVNPRAHGKGSGRIQTIGMVHIAVDGVILQIRAVYPYPAGGLNLR